MAPIAPTMTEVHKLGQEQMIQTICPMITAIWGQSDQ